MNRIDATEGAMLKGRALGSWTTGTVNTCRAVLAIDGASELRITFAWTLKPGPDDVAEFNCAILPDALRRATAPVDELAAIEQAIRGLAHEGSIRKVGIRDGNWLWEASEGSV